MTSDRRDEIERQFGRAAELYARSEHRDGEDLERLRAWARPRSTEVLLDVATGAGHTALHFAPHVRHVVVTDLADGMLARAREMFARSGVSNAEFRSADVQALPFAAERFDYVTCRIAAHHFLDLVGALAEITRVLRPGGAFLLVDSTAPEDADAARFLDEVERLRDATHVCSHSRAAWLSMCGAAGLRVEHQDVIRKRRAFEFWLDRGGCDDVVRAELRARFAGASDKLRSIFEIEIDAGEVKAFSDDKIVLAARK